MGREMKARWASCPPCQWARYRWGGREPRCHLRTTPRPKHYLASELLCRRWWVWTQNSVHLWGFFCELLGSL